MKTANHKHMCKQIVQLHFGLLAPSLIAYTK